MEMFLVSFGSLIGLIFGILLVKGINWLSEKLSKNKKDSTS